MALYDWVRNLIANLKGARRDASTVGGEDTLQTEVARLGALVAHLSKENAKVLGARPEKGSHTLDDLLPEEDKALTLARLVRDYAKEAETSGASVDPCQRFAQQLAVQLNEILLGGEGPQFARAGEGEYHEGSGWPLRELFVRLVRRSATYLWTPHDIAQHRYEKNKCYEAVPGFRVARAESVTHVEDLSDPFSVLIYERIRGPTFSQLLLEIAKALDFPDYTNFQKRQLLGIGSGLIRRSFEQVHKYLEQRPSHLPHTASQVRDGYIQVLKRVPPVFEAMEIVLSEEKKKLWEKSVEILITKGIPFDECFIVPYRDTALTNLILEPESKGLREEYERGLPFLTIPLILAEFSGTKGILDYRLTKVAKPDPRVVNVDLGHRGAHALDDFSHIFVSREATPFITKRDEERYLHGHAEFLRSSLGIDLSGGCRSLYLAAAAMGFNRAARRIPNTFDFYGNLVYEHYQRERIGSERFAARREKFGADILSYIDESVERALEVVDLSLRDIKGDPQNIRELATAIRASDLYYINASTAAPCLDQLGSASDATVQLVLAGLYAQLILHDLKGQFAQKGGLRSASIRDEVHEE